MIDLAHTVARLGGDLIAWCLIMSVSTAALLALAISADLLLARRVRAAWRIYLYAPVLLRVLIPASATLALPILAPAQSSNSTMLASFTIRSARDFAATPSPTTAAPNPWLIACAIIYALGVIILTLRWARDARHISRVLRAATPSDLGRRIVLSPHAGPMVAGVFNPTIVLPAWIVSLDALPLVVAHERAHISRRDPLLAAALRLMCTIAWPIIPVWIASSRVRALFEQACDERALRTHAASRQEVIVSYASALIDVAARSSRRAWTLAFGSSLSARIQALRHDRHWTTAPQLLLVMGIATLLIGCSVVKPSPAQSDASQPAMAIASDQAPVEPSIDTAAPDTAPQHRAATWGLNVAPEDVLQPMMMLPVDEEFRVNVRIMEGDLPIEWPDAQEASVAVMDRQQLADVLDNVAQARVIAWPRLAVAASQPAEVRMTWDNVEFAFNIVVYPTTTDIVTAGVSYTEGAYHLGTHTLKMNLSDASIVRIPPASADAPSRTLVITIQRPSDDC